MYLFSASTLPKIRCRGCIRRHICQLMATLCFLCPLGKKTPQKRTRRSRRPRSKLLTSPSVNGTSSPLSRLTVRAGRATKPDDGGRVESVTVILVVPHQLAGGVDVPRDATFSGRCKTALQARAGATSSLFPICIYALQWKNGRQTRATRV